MRKYQRGVTAIGWIVLLIPFAIVFYAGIRLAPLYLNYMKVVHTLDQVSTEVAGDTATADGIRNSIGKHFDIESVDYPAVKDLKVTRENGAWRVQANYDDQAPLFANLFILVTFDKTVKLKGGGE
ncbi:MAG: DUF4845 domain-containing protein [Steroidobacteraceae bacterium]